MTCQYTISGCSYPQGECSGACMTDQGRESQRLIRNHLASQQPEALRLADVLDLLAMDMNTPRQAAAELRRLCSQNQELLVALKRIAMAAEAAVCNVEWIAHHARAAITNAGGAA